MSIWSESWVNAVCPRLQASSHAENPVLWQKKRAREREKISPLYLKPLEYFQIYQSPSPCTSPSSSLPHTTHTHVRKIWKTQKNTPYSISSHKCVWKVKLGSIYLFLPYRYPKRLCNLGAPVNCFHLWTPPSSKEKNWTKKNKMCIGHVHRTQSGWTGTMQ